MSHARQRTRSAARWTDADVPPQKGRVAVVTGSNTGLGFQVARVLAAHGGTVVLAARDMTKAEAAADRILTASPETTVTVAHLDLASLASVRAAANALRDAYERIDLLINNAGVMMTPYGQTEDGFEQQLGVNHLGPFALTSLLLDRMLTVPGSRSRTRKPSRTPSPQGTRATTAKTSKRPRARPMRCSRPAMIFVTARRRASLAGAAAGPDQGRGRPGWACSRGRSACQRQKPSVRRMRARIPDAWTARNCRQAGDARRGAGPSPAAARIRRIVPHPVPQAQHLALDPPVTPTVGSRGPSAPPAHAPRPGPAGVPACPRRSISC